MIKVLFIFLGWCHFWPILASWTLTIPCFGQMNNIFILIEKTQQYYDIYVQMLEEVFLVLFNQTFPSHSRVV